VFPIAALPNTSFTTPCPNLGKTLRSRQRFGKAHFDQPSMYREVQVPREAGCRKRPTSGKIGIVWRQFDHAMQMIRQHYPAVNRKGVASPHRTHGVAQQVNMPCQKIVAMPLQQVDSEEIGATWVPGATVIRHGGSIVVQACGAMPFGYCALRAGCFE